MLRKPSISAAVIAAGCVAVALAQQRLTLDDGKESNRTQTPTLKKQGSDMPTLDEPAAEMPTLTPESLVQDRSVAAQQRAALGVILVDTPHGPTVEAVYAGSPASEAGLQSGDLLLKLNGTVPRTTADLVSAIGRMEPGQEVTVEFLRNGQPSQATARLAERDAIFTLPGGIRYFAQRPVRDPMPELHRMREELELLKEQVASLRRDLEELRGRVNESSNAEEETKPPPHAGAIIDEASS